VASFHLSLCSLNWIELEFYLEKASFFAPVELVLRYAVVLSTRELAFHFVLAELTAAIFPG